MGLLSMKFLTGTGSKSGSNKRFGIESAKGSRVNGLRWKRGPRGVLFFGQEFVESSPESSPEDAPLLASERFLCTGLTM